MVLTTSIGSAVLTRSAGAITSGLCLFVRKLADGAEPRVVSCLLPRDDPKIDSVRGVFRRRCDGTSGRRLRALRRRVRGR